MAAAGVFASEEKPDGGHHTVPLVRAPNGAPVIGFAGWSGSGKTTLVTQVVAALTAKGWNVAVVKHAHHMSDIDHPGKDSWRHRHAGARQVVVASPRRWAVIYENQNQTEAPMLSELLAALRPCDLVLVEGYKRAAIPKVEVWRGETFGPALWPEDTWVFAVATTPDLRAKLSCNRLMLPLENPDAIAMAVVDLIRRSTVTVKMKAPFTR
ncbi:molybdopterin-guanine dinucleotide biosynthesis protein B [Hydrogenophilus thiooxidans]|uniref:molybdopterin-guanine dinucleotide biosynthesis protein B n=1 Tax=Hydrogenophilus thiooxidans TaxID=2820326 RepID=UPI001C23631C|nr:molybdopterin-guanine dinucleotide biosynthesis protein B [Hydrogenophilus thiooxidans]